MNSNLSDVRVFTYVGATVLLFYFFKFCFVSLRFLYFSFTKAVDGNINWKELGRWAVVTGGSDGIGKAYAEALAAKGFHLVLISRTEEKLTKVALEISERYSVQVRTICIDFTDHPKIYETIKEELQDREVGVLVNNIGMSYDHTEYFHAIPEGFQVMEKIIRANIVSCTMMTRMVLQRMERVKKGVIINISSLTALYPMPLLNVYAASKAYVDYFSRALHVEYKDKGVYIQSVLPGYVATKMSNRRPSLEIPSAEVFVQSAIKAVGLEYYTFGYGAHNIRGFVHEWLKDNMPTWVNMAIAMYYMKKSRDKYFKKLQKMKKEQSSD